MKLLKHEYICAALINYSIVRRKMNNVLFEYEDKSKNVRYMGQIYYLSKEAKRDDSQKI